MGNDDRQRATLLHVCPPVISSTTTNPKWSVGVCSHLVACVSSNPALFSKSCVFQRHEHGRRHPTATTVALACQPTPLH
eukprot:m.311615 g.311615  ORF g.311615 m.311615 type:complete len:79 (-) comp23045_c0_seq5:926-1162(-)